MDVEFARADLDRLYTDRSFGMGFPVAVVKAYRKCLQVIISASDERDFYQLKSLHFEKLKGNRAHQHSMRLNKQFRLILELRGKGRTKVVVVMNVEDYH